MTEELFYYIKENYFLFKMWIIKLLIYNNNERILSILHYHIGTHIVNSFNLFN